MDYQAILEEIHGEVADLVGSGKVADYIPALARVPADKFGMALQTLDGRLYRVGHAEEPLSVQSVSKVFALTLALETLGDPLWQRVGREPSGSPFNSLVQLEYEAGIPRNPFINAGALVVTDALASCFEKPAEQTIAFVDDLAGNPGLTFDPEVYRSEVTHGDLNRATAYFLKAHDNLENPVQRVTHAYFRLCALSMSCVELARAAAFLANGGATLDGRRVVAERRAKRINAVMLTCGLYDGVGEFAFRVGMPAKSGVGGAIIAVIPGLLSVAVWSPGLDSRGNSIAGVKALELLTTRVGRSVF